MLLVTSHRSGAVHSPEWAAKPEPCLGRQKAGVVQLVLFAIGPRWVNGISKRTNTIMTTIAILIILIVIQLLLSWLMPVEAKRMVVTPATKVAVCWSVDWAPCGFMSAGHSTMSRQILGLRYGGSYDYSLSYSYRQPVAVAKVMVQSPFYLEEEDEQE